MAGGNTSGGLGKSRYVLGDLTNRIGKRGIPVGEKIGIESFDFSDKDVVKRIRVSPRLCAEINSLTGNAVSDISRKPNVKRDPNVPRFGTDNSVSKSSIDVDTEGNNQTCLKEKNVVMGSSIVPGGSNNIMSLDLGGRDVYQSVNKLDTTHNKFIDSHGKVDHVEDVALPMICKMPSQDGLDSNLTDLEGATAVNSITSEADDCAEPHSLKENRSLGISKVVSEDECPSLEPSARKTVVDLNMIAGGEFASGSSKMSKEENDPNLVDLGKCDAVECIHIEANGQLRDRYPADSSRTVTETDGHGVHDDSNCNAGDVNVCLDGSQSDTKIYHNSGVDDHNAGNLVLSQSGSVDCTILPESQESKVLGVDRSTKLEDGCGCVSGATDSIIACSCSFCTKAAHLWFDLHQQDIKGRVSAIKKSQKEARIFAERNCSNKVTEKHGGESFTRVSKLECHLMYQWRSLFQHMTDIWEEEGNQLEASLLLLTDLRKKCKADLN